MLSPEVRQRILLLSLIVLVYETGSSDGDRVTTSSSSSNGNTILSSSNFNQDKVTTSSSSSGGTTSDSSAGSMVTTSLSSNSIGAGSVGPTAVQLDDVRKLLIEEHDNIRIAHGLPKFTVNPKLDEMAKDCAVKMAEADKLLPTCNPDIGWNIISQGSSKFSPDKFAQDTRSLWYDGQICGYDYSAPTYTKTNNAFIQLLWKDTKFVGLGIAASKSNKTYLAVSYYVKVPETGPFSDETVPRPLDPTLLESCPISTNDGPLRRGLFWPTMY